MSPGEEIVRYKRSRFSTRLPVDRIYTRSHYWLHRDPAGLWRVGLTKFATRMLGDLVELELTAAPGSAVEVGKQIGWIEGFKAVSDLYAVASGAFAGGNEALAGDITLLESEPYGAGWLYAVDGEPEPDGLNVHEYVNVLDATIDRMLASRGEGDPDA
ncbi:MAG: glycine cleavage system protein H [Acidobacteria bacterium]|nr:glycine cleavage system protein H [Acidobacteriota bacterium]